MGLIVQDDTGTVAGANAYITVEQFVAYHADRGNSYLNDPEQIAAKIILASDYVDQRFSYKGRKLNTRLQRSQWPRTNCYDDDRNYVNGIPQEVKDATAEYALRAMKGTLNPDPINSTTGGTVTMKKEIIGPIEETTQYTSSDTFKMPRYPAADSILTRAGLTIAGGSTVRG